MRSNGVITMTICPNGIVQSIIPEGLPGWDAVYGLNLLQVCTGTAVHSSGTQQRYAKQRSIMAARTGGIRGQLQV